MLFSVKVLFLQKVKTKVQKGQICLLFLKVAAPDRSAHIQESYSEGLQAWHPFCLVTDAGSGHAAELQLQRFIAKKAAFFSTTP